MILKKKTILIAQFAIILMARPCAGAGPTLGYEFVGQVLNPSATQSIQYGYLNSVAGLDSVATSGAVSEATALLTFYNDTTTQRVINNGPIRIIDRTGSSTLYFNAGGGGDFNNADTFRAGKPVQTCSLRHQVVIDTSTGYFTASFELTITSVGVFQLNGASYILGKPGEVYRWNVYGKLATPGPPAANIAGFASGSKARMISTD